MGTTPKNKAIDAEYLLKQFKAFNTKVFEKTYGKIKNAIFTGSFSHNRKADTTIGTNSFAEGNNTTASGNFSHAEGDNTIASGESSHTEGSGTTASGVQSHAEGGGARAEGNYSHAEGGGTVASGICSHAEGISTTADGEGAHSSGKDTLAEGDYSATFGNTTIAEGKGSLAAGAGTVASGNYSTVIGTGNDPQPDDLFEIGNGSVLDAQGNILPEASRTKSNALRVTKDGRAIAETDVELENGIKLSNREAVSNKVTSIGNNPTNTQYPSAKAVKDYIDAMPEPMIFKGTLGTGGTVTSLPSAAASNEGFTYKVITAGTYQGVAAKVGDTLISNGSAWVLIPSGDEPMGTVTNVAAKGSNGINVTGGPITSSGTLVILGVDASQSASGMMSAADKKKLDDIASGAEVNQNAFSNVVVGSTTIAADSKTDTLTLAGSNVTITPDATNDKVTIGITKANVTSALGYTPPTTNTTYGVATSSALGLVKSGTDITVDSSGNVSVNDDSHNHVISNVDGLQNALDGKLSKTTYEYNKELAIGSSDKGVCIGVFPCSDSCISVEIKSTTSTTYNGTLVIATQNINNTGGGSYTATVFGDEKNTLTSAIKIQYLSGSNAFSVYINLAAWSKNLFHIQCVYLAGAPSSIVTIVDSIPSTATIIPTNAFTHTHTELMSKNNPTGTGSFSLNRKAGSTVGSYSHAVGYQTEASGYYSHAEGASTKASGYYSHVEGAHSTARGACSHAEGYGTNSFGDYSHAEGYYTSAGESAHAEGYRTTAGVAYSHAEGYYCSACGSSGGNDDSTGHAGAHAGGNHSTAGGLGSFAHGNYAVAKGNQLVIGHYNKRGQWHYTDGWYDGAYSGTGTSTAFLIGNGTSSSQSNAMRADYNGKLWCLQAYSATGADYAELFEWKDGNKNNEDRRGYFVTLDGINIKKATSTDDYILGVISAAPTVIGNGDDEWSGRYLRDKFGSFITVKEQEEKIVTDNYIDENGDMQTSERVVTYEYEHYKENPEYDPNREYVDRIHRPEWDAVGMMGVLIVRQDGTAIVNKYVCSNDEGIATLCEKKECSYRVVEVIDNETIKILIK